MPTTSNASTMLARMAQEPLLIAPGSEEMLTAYITSMQDHEDFGAAHEATGQTDEFWDDEDEFISWLRPYNVQNGTLIIPVHGVLIHKMSFKFGSWATGYGYIARALERGLDDPEVHTIAFDSNSPGGTVAGNFELVEKIVAARGEKRMVAYANDYAFSAAYNIAAAADEIVLSRSGGVGSVGVVKMHIDYSGNLEKNGVKVTFFFAGKHKVEGNPYEALPDAAKARIQARIDRLYGEFVGLVADNRGMEEKAVRDTEALTFDASEAVEVGFADRIGTLEEELAAQSEAEQESEPMATTPTKNPAASNEGSQITQAQLDSAVEAAKAEAKAEGQAEGVTAERARIDGILGCDEAKTRPAAAKMAVSAGMSVEDAQKALAAMPEEKPAAAAPKEEPKGEGNPAPLGSNPTPFGEGMSGTGVGAAPKGEGGEGGEKDEAADILGSLSMITGRDYGQKKSA